METNISTLITGKTHILFKTQRHNQQYDLWRHSAAFEEHLEKKWEVNLSNMTKGNLLKQELEIY